MGCAAVSFLLAVLLASWLVLEFYWYEPFPIPVLGQSKEEVWEELSGFRNQDRLLILSNCVRPLDFTRELPSRLAECSYWHIIDHDSGQSMQLSFEGGELVRGEYRHQRWDNLIFSGKKIEIR